MWNSTKSLRGMVDQQVGRWSLEEKQRKEKAPKHWRCIAISREFGSQGAAVGQAVAEQLGFSFWDNELVQAITEETGAREALIASVDEASRSGLDDLITSVIMGVNASQREYIRQLTRIIGTIEQHGSAVIMGRGAAFILRDQCLTVRIVAPFAHLSEQYATREGVELKEAQKLLRAKEKDRAKFIRTRFERDIDEAREYDLTINTGRMPLEIAAKTIVSAYRHKFGGLPERAA